MKSDLRLYIEGRQVDLGSDLDIAMTYQLEDLTNPTVTKVGYSKTISLEGTQNNNQIFGDIWDLRRTQMYDSTKKYLGVYFDPSKRASAVVYNNSELVEDGYVKLDTITRDGESIKYNITFYAALADFFYTLSYDSEGEERTLASLDYGEDLGFNITMDNVKDAWGTLEGTVNSTKWQKINFAPMYNGLPEDFGTDKAIINFKDNATFTAPSTTATYRTYENKGFAAAELEEEYDEWEMRDLRSYNQRPILSVKAFFDAVQRSALAEGWTLDLDKQFFNDSNEYYSNAWITLPLLSALDSVGGETKTGTCSGGVWAAPSDNKRTEKDLSWSGEISGTTISLVENGTYTATVPVIVRCVPSLAGAPSTLYSNYTIYADYITYDEEAQQTYTDHQVAAYGGRTVQVQLIAVDGDGNTVGSSPVKYLTGNYVYNTKRKAYYYTEDGASSFNLTIEDLSKPDEVTFKLVLTNANITHLYNKNTYTRRYYWYNVDEGGWETEDNDLPVGYGMSTFYYATADGSLVFTEFSSVHSGLLVTQKKLLASESTPCDYLLSFAKIFGLYFIKDLGEKTVHLITRNRFFTGEVEDLGDLIDYSKSQTITPITFEAKYYNMELETEETVLSTKYKDEYSRTYGTQKINTNYNFDSEINELYEDNAFKGAVEGYDSSNYFRHFKNPSWSSTNKVYYPTPLYDSLTYFLVKNGTDLDTTQESDVQKMETCTYINFNQKPQYDCNPRLCLRDSDDEGVDGENILIFYRGSKAQADANGNEITYYLTDDNSTMFLLNDNEACWWITDSEYDTDGDRIAYACTSLPDFGRYYFEDGRIVSSMDFGEPQELYINATNTSDSTVYHKYWKNFYDDQLDVNTRIIETYVLLDKKFTQDNMRKFYFFDGCYWFLNKVTDYTLGDSGTVKCEFIKIQDTDNYDEGQATDYPAGSIEFEYTSGSYTYGSQNTLLSYEALNVEDLRVSSNSTWINTTLNTDDNTVSVVIYANPNSDMRTGKITLSGTNYGGVEISATYIVTQAAYVYLTIDPTSKNASAEGETFTIAVSTNLSQYDAISSASWISLIKAPTKTTVTVAANNDTSSRVATIRFIGQGYKGSALFTVTQEAYVENTFFHYTSTDGNTVTPYTLTATDADGNSLTYTNTYTDGVGTIQFNGMVEDMGLSFLSCTTLASLYGLNNKVYLASGRYMFYLCSGLTSLNLTNFDTSKVTDMDHMFSGTSVTTLDLSGFDTSNVTDMQGMFNAARSLVSVDLSSFNTSNVTDMAVLFSGASSVISVDISTFDTSKVNNMNRMFYNATSLNKLTVGMSCTQDLARTKERVTDMLTNVSSSGTLYYPTGMPAQNNWLPSGWTSVAY